jgi:hypothetical protein
MCKIVSLVEWNFFGALIWHPNAFEVETRVFLELMCYEAVSFSEPQLPPKFASLKHVLLA